ncbi:hypothetical protein BHM03_00026018 [Ensete ventricosum]|nr:hypothetical protein BHM03_00026018 [Ensete ventricosum]
MDVMDATLTTRHPQHLRLLPMEISIKVLVLALVGGGTDADRSHCLLVGVPVMWNSLQLSAAGCRRKKRRSSNLDQLHLHSLPAVGLGEACIARQRFTVVLQPTPGCPTKQRMPLNPEDLSPPPFPPLLMMALQYCRTTVLPRPRFIEADALPTVFHAIFPRSLSWNHELHTAAMAEQ